MTRIDEKALAAAKREAGTTGGTIESTIRAYLSALEPAPAEAEGWRPIESAPRDGSMVDLWSDRWGRLAGCRWDTGKWWHSRQGYEEYEFDPTHWMPLPPAPAEAEGWKPIESAPRDGTAVLLWFDHHPVSMGRYEYGTWLYAFCMTEGGDTPRGWMPIPPAPAGKE